MHLILYINIDILNGFYFHSIWKALIGACPLYLFLNLLFAFHPNTIISHVLNRIQSAAAH